MAAMAISYCEKADRHAKTISGIAAKFQGNLANMTLTAYK